MSHIILIEKAKIDEPHTKSNHKKQLYEKANRSNKICSKTREKENQMMLLFAIIALLYKSKTSPLLSVLEKGKLYLLATPLAIIAMQSPSQTNKS